MILMGVFDYFTYLFDVLEAVDDKTLDADAAEYLVIVDHDRLDCVQAFYLGQENERVQVVVCKYKFLKFCKLLELVQVLVIHD